MGKRVANGEAIRRIRDLAGMTQRYLAEQVGISESAMSQIESGGGMKPANVRLAANALGVPVTSLTQAALTAAEVCKALHITREELAQIVAAEELPMISGCVTETALEEYIARRLPEMAATP